VGCEADCLRPSRGRACAGASPRVSRGTAVAGERAGVGTRVVTRRDSGIHLPSPEAVYAFRDRLVAEEVEIGEEWDEPEYVSVKFLDPDGYVIAAWEPHLD
jgi:hypothetical protein